MRNVCRYTALDLNSRVVCFAEFARPVSGFMPRIFANNGLPIRSENNRLYPNLDTTDANDANWGLSAWTRFDGRGRLGPLPGDRLSDRVAMFRDLATQLQSFDAPHGNISEAALQKSAHGHQFQLVGQGLGQAYREWRIMHGLIVGDSTLDPRFAPAGALVTCEANRMVDLHMLWRLCWQLSELDPVSMPADWDRNRVLSDACCVDIRNIFDWQEIAWAAADKEFTRLMTIQLPATKVQSKEPGFPTPRRTPSASASTADEEPLDVSGRPRVQLPPTKVQPKEPGFPTQRRAPSGPASIADEEPLDVSGRLRGIQIAAVFVAVILVVAGVVWFITQSRAEPSTPVQVGVSEGVDDGIERTEQNVEPTASAPATVDELVTTPTMTEPSTVAERSVIDDDAGPVPGVKPDGFVWKRQYWVCCQLATGFGDTANKCEISDGDVATLRAKRSKFNPATNKDSDLDFEDGDQLQLLGKLRYSGGAEVFEPTQKGSELVGLAAAVEANIADAAPGGLAAKITTDCDPNGWHLVAPGPE